MNEILNGFKHRLFGGFKQADVMKYIKRLATQRNEYRDMFEKASMENEKLQDKIAELQHRIKELEALQTQSDCESCAKAIVAEMPELADDIAIFDEIDESPVEEVAETQDIEISNEDPSKETEEIDKSSILIDIIEPRRTEYDINDDDENTVIEAFSDNIGDDAELPALNDFIETEDTTAEEVTEAPVADTTVAKEPTSVKKIKLRSRPAR